MSKSNPLKHIRADFLGHLKRFYKADSSPDGRRHVEFLQDVVRCLPVDLREAYWDLQLVALACTYLADGGRIETLYRYGFSQNMVNAVRLLTPCYPPDEPEDGPGHFRYVLRLLRSRISCTVRYADSLPILSEACCKGTVLGTCIAFYAIALPRLSKAGLRKSPANDPTQGT